MPWFCCLTVIQQFSGLYLTKGRKDLGLGLQLRFMLDLGFGIGLGLGLGTVLGPELNPGIR